MVQRASKDKGNRRQQPQQPQQEQQQQRPELEKKRWSKRKQASSFLRSSSTSLQDHDSFHGTKRRDSKLASQKREHESRGTRTRRRPNGGGSFSSRGSATGMQCGLCAVLAGLFRRAMCIAGSRRGSGESCYQELATEMQQVQHGHRVQVSGQRQQQVQTSGFIVAGSPAGTLVSVKRSVSSGSLGSIQRFKDCLRQERTAEEITVDGTGQNAVSIRISEQASLASSGESPSATTSAVCPDENEFAAEAMRRLSAADRFLIENLDIGLCRTKHTGRFLTMHKRRRKRLMTRTLIQEPGLLDDILHGQVQCVLQRAGNWRFNAFTLETVTGGRSLPVLCVHLFQWYGLFQRFNLDVVRVWKLFALIEEGYHSTNPYHNSIHATDVTQAMHCFLQEEKIKRHLSSLEIMASLIAAVTHDLDHPGVNQPFLVATSNHLATLYENTSVLENHHWRSAIGCLLESGVSDQLSAEIRPELQRHISSLILATDITRQQEFITKFKTYIDTNALDMERPENRHFVLQISLKCADISNPCRPWDISRKWSYKVCEEFFRQGDYERKLNLPVTPLCDRQSISIAKIQAGFFEFVVTPLYDEWQKFLGDGLSVSLMTHLRTNHKRWESLIAREAAEETKTEMSDLEEVENSSSSVDERGTTITREDSESVRSALPETDVSLIVDRRPSLPGQLITPRVNRRHSVPLSVTKPPLSLIRTSNNRRDSLPVEHPSITTKNHRISRFDEKTFEDAFDRLSSRSLLSSKSSIYESAGNASSSCERPVSAENLLPETSIASITSSVEASRLSTLLQPETQKSSQTKHLTRQQTFPPLQPYVRTRYMSTTVEMSKCKTEILVEAEDSASRSTSERSTTETKSDPAQSCDDCSNVDCESWKLKKTDCATLRLSRDHVKNDCENSRKRETVFTDLTRQSLDVGISSSNVDFSRRHSVQIVRIDDSNFLGLKNRHKRPSSAQETYPTQMFYASLIGASRIAKKSDVSELSEVETRNDSRKDSYRTDDTTDQYASIKNILRSSESASSVANSVAATSDMCSVLSEDYGQIKDTELRRYSTPVGVTRPTGSENNGRRFTAIPVTSELSIHKVFFIGSPPPSPPRIQSASSSSDSSGEQRQNVGDFGGETISVGSKRDSDRSRQISSKLPKLSDESRMKENVDPRMIEESNKSNISTARRNTQGWARRRGSAPVGLLPRLDDCPIAVAAVAPRIDRHSSRRGSVPTDISENQGGSFRLALGPRGENVPSPRRASLPQEAALSNLFENIFLPEADRENFSSNNNVNNNNNNNNSTVIHAGSNNNGSSRLTEAHVSVGMPSPRRGSVPADISELRRDFFGRNSINGKARNRKKTLRRRSSGGPEMFAGGNVDDNENTKSFGSKRDLKRDAMPEPSIKRRGSLPVEMVPIFHPGSAVGARRSSLWRL